MLGGCLSFVKHNLTKALQNAKYPEKKGTKRRLNSLSFCLQLIAMSDIKEVIPDFQKLTKMENCIVIHLKNDTKLAITSPVSFSLFSNSRTRTEYP